MAKSKPATATFINLTQMDDPRLNPQDENHFMYVSKFAEWKGYIAVLPFGKNAQTHLDNWHAYRVQIFKNEEVFNAAVKNEKIGNDRPRSDDMIFLKWRERTDETGNAERFISWAYDDHSEEKWYRVNMWKNANGNWYLRFTDKDYRPRDDWKLPF